jgi:hypothetical protein
VLNIVFQFVVLWASVAQSSTTTLRTGDVARQLTEQDIAALELVLPSGRKLWFLNGDPAQMPKSQLIQAFLFPITATPLSRRGLVFWIKRGIDPITEWTAEAAESYAQVAIPGRDFDQIEGDQDINRPFRVVGNFSDSELVRLVDVLRSNPPTRGRGANAIAIQPWPILSVERRANDSVKVMLREAVGRGQGITLRQAGQDWIIVEVGMWIA